MDREALAEYRYRAVLEVLSGAAIGEVAARYGTSRQSLHTWRQRFREEGRPGLLDRSRRPHHSPLRLAAELEATICELRRRFPRWGARRISFELHRHGVDGAPSRATVHRVLTRNGMIDAQAQEHKRTYRRWQRDAPMHLWQLDLVGGVPLADGREAKMLTGIDDHSRFVVVAAVLVIPSGRAVCEAFTAAMRRYGAPFEVLTDIQAGCRPEGSLDCPAGGVRISGSGTRSSSLLDRLERCATSCLLTMLAGGATAGGWLPC